MNYADKGIKLTLTVLSSEEVIKLRLSNEKSTDLTAPVCPFNTTDSPFLQKVQCLICGHFLSTG